MITDTMDQGVTHEMRQILLIFTTIVEDQMPGKECHIHPIARVHRTTSINIGPLLRTEKTEWTLLPHFMADVFVPETFDPEQSAMVYRQAPRFLQERVLFGTS